MLLTKIKIFIITFAIAILSWNFLLKDSINEFSHIYTQERIEQIWKNNPEELYTLANNGAKVSLTIKGHLFDKHIKLNQFLINDSVDIFLIDKFKNIAGDFSNADTQSKITITFSDKINTTPSDISYRVAIKKPYLSYKDDEDISMGQLELFSKIVDNYESIEPAKTNLQLTFKQVKDEINYILKI